MKSAPTIAGPSWSLEQDSGSQPFAGGVVRLDLATPSTGLRLHHADGRVDRLLGIDLTTLADHWARGADIAAVYEPTDARRLRSTVMWRTHPHDDGVSAWEVIASAQTSLLETDVSVAVHSEFDAAAIAWTSGRQPLAWQLLPVGRPLPDDATALLARRGGSSCLVAVHPADARRVEVAFDGGRCAIDCRLFAAALEKGVLLRSRVLAAVGPSHEDEAWAGRLLHAFASSPPPLTT